MIQGAWIFPHVNANCKAELRSRQREQPSISPVCGRPWLGPGAHVPACVGPSRLLSAQCAVLSGVAEGGSPCCSQAQTGQGAEPQSPARSARTMPNGIKPVDPLDSLPSVSSVSSAYRSSGQPGTCKYWILDLGTPAPPTRRLLLSFRSPLGCLPCAFPLHCCVLH